MPTHSKTNQKLYVVGIGPGDPELLTIKAVKILQSVPCIFVPKGRQEGSSIALSIISKVIDLNGKEIIDIHFPMLKTKPTDSVLQDDTHTTLQGKWQEGLKQIINQVSQGKDTAFITLGDPMIYSTFFYLYNKLLEAMPELEVQFIPGISSINAVASRASISLSLADESIAVLPANYLPDISYVLTHFDTVILMKVHKTFNQILQILKDLDLTSKSVYVCRAYMPDEKIFYDISKVKEGDLDYFSVLIVKK